MSQSTLNEDWLKSLTWDLWRVDTLITTVPDLLWALRVSEAPLVEQQAAIQKFTKNPSWIPAPQELKDAVAVFLASGEIQKGDVPGHIFHGNQYEAGEGGGISRFERFPKPEEVGGEAHFNFVWNRPRSWYPNEGQDPTKALVPRVPTHDDLLNAVREWKGDPKIVRAMYPEILAGLGNPPWATVAQEDDRAACAALMNEIATNPQASEGTLWRGMTLGSKDSTMEEIMQRFQVGSTVDVPVSGFSENRNQSMRFAVGGVGRPKEEGIAVMYSLSSGAQGLPLDGNIYHGHYAYEKEWAVGGKLQIDKVETMGSGSKQYIKVSVTQTQPLTAPAGGFR